MKNTLLGPAADSTWEITGADAGTLNGQIGFVGVENLTGAAGNQDGFVFFIEGSIAGEIAGGAGGSDGMIVEDPAESGVFDKILDKLPAGKPLEIELVVAP